MKTIDEIINEYEQTINPDNNGVENIVMDAVPIVIEGFIDFYGEECREEIIEKFSRIKIVFPPIDMFNNFFNLMSKINRYLEEKYPNEHDLHICYEKLSSPKVREGKSIEYIKMLDEIQQKLAPFYDLSEQYFNLERVLKKKINKEYQGELNRFIKEVLSKELNYTEEMIARYNIPEDDVYFKFHCFESESLFDIKSPYDIIRIITNARAFGIYIPPLQCEKKNYSKWDSIDFRLAKEEFIKIINDPNVKKYIPSKKNVKKILDKESSLEAEKQEQVNIECVKQFYGIRNELSNYLGIKGIPPIRTNDTGIYTPALMKNDDKIEIGGVLSLNKLMVEPEELGEVLIHEGNHGLETTIDNNDSTYCLKSGWDIIHVRDSTTHKLVVEHDFTLKSYRPLELLNECVNDLITKEILDNIRKKTNNIIFRKFKENLYSHAYFVVEEFYQLYKPEIIESRKNHNMAALYQKIGYENFEALANLMQEVSSKLYNGEFNYKSAKQNLENGISNTESDFLMYVIKKRDQILGNMKEYSQKSHGTRGK